MKRLVMVECSDFQRFPTLLIGEKEPDPFAWQEHFTTRSVRDKLAVGSVSLPGCSGEISIQRFSFKGLISAISWADEPFKDLLKLAVSVPKFTIICEGSYEELFKAPREANHQRPWDTVMSYGRKYRIPILFAGSCEMAAHLAEATLKGWLTEQQKNLNSFCKSMGMIEKKEAKE